MAQNIDSSDLKELAEYDNSPSKDRPIFLNDNEEHCVQNKESLENASNEIAALNSDQKKEKPPQDSDIRQLIREECCVKVYEEQKQNLIESALNTKLFSINSQRLDNKEQEVKNVVEQPAERGNLAPILSTKEPEHSPSMGYENSNTTLETESDEIIKSGVEELVPILSKYEVTSEDKRECDVLVFKDSSAFDVCDDHSEIFSDSKNDDDISVYDDFEDVEYVEASLLDPENVSDVEEENVVHQAEKNDVEEEEIEPDQERLINVKSNISDESSNDPLLEEADLFLASDNSIPSGIENSADDPEGDIRFLEELLIDDSILSHESSDSNLDDNPSVPLPPPEPPDEEFDFGDEISVVIDKLEESEDTIFDPGISD
nr:hypothetical protein [Tanacetum cinerariifolium]